VLSDQFVAGCDIWGMIALISPDLVNVGGGLNMTAPPSPAELRSAVLLSVGFSIGTKSNWDSNQT
jgi:hypothetical protein